MKQITIYVTIYNQTIRSILLMNVLSDRLFSSAYSRSPLVLISLAFTSFCGGAHSFDMELLISLRNTHRQLTVVLLF